MAAAGLPGDYEVPAFSAFATENPAMKWDFYVRHYADDARQRRDPKYRERWTERDDSDGVLYPRAGCLGGCTAHNAMITVHPHNADWEHIRQLTGDQSWSAESMRGYFERLEECRHRPIMRFLAKLGFNPSRHGWSGWLPTEVAVPMGALDDEPLADLFCFAILGDFRGYFPGYSARFRTEKNYLTWVILKGHTNNRAGTVRLRSADPRDTPVIAFHSFDEGTDDGGEDVRSVVEGIEFVRRLTRSMIEDGWITEEELPGGAVTDRADLERFVKDHAWGHHASCSCPIGDPGDGGVVDGDFRVHGVSGLRIVDASVFPKIPGFFIVSSVYTIAEKAADVMMGVGG